ncbi:MAG: hypothetical protein F6K04_05260 [Leptolyngbya sp. SIO4C5]|uniref:hypothetical protein n=1 Tax=Sphaerothrix gracilis TaxID=3151835 RepID=UPI0013BF7325|nr:hypothetical protein [Leptolyngbya sp. SIO4C5]
MNARCIVFSSLITCLVGAMLGLGLAEINRDRYPSQMHGQYAIAGAMGGLLIGAAQEALRQKAEQELE